ncbi:MAG: tyrosine-type recombinase/integrase [Rhodospirillaceae bacterium]|nr:tyrosine-type recombinase/integrase [Rhodospirillaceae bacterium]
MFEKLFKDPRTIDQYRAAPLVEHRLRYLRHRAGTGILPGTVRAIASILRRLVYLLDLRELRLVSVAEVEAAVEARSFPRLYKYRRPVSSSGNVDFVARAVRWLRFMGCLEERETLRHPHRVEVAEYERWMLRERGLSDETIRAAISRVHLFFDWLAENELPLASLRITDIDRAIADKKGRRTYSRITIAHYAREIRAFIRYAEGRGLCRPDMAPAIIPPRKYPTEMVPAGLRWDDVKRLLASTEDGRPADKRDRAILMLLIAYGLRSGEVRGLRLEDIDWENETLRVRRSKTGRTDIYSLSHGVGQAILRYLMDVRPSCSERTLFLTLVRPVRPLTQSGLGAIVGRRVKRLGVVAKRKGPNALRHAAAQRLLDQGMSMKVIGDFLGHREPSSTAIYTHGRRHALRPVSAWRVRWVGRVHFWYQRRRRRRRHQLKGNLQGAPKRCLAAHHNNLYFNML